MRLEIDLGGEVKDLAGLRVLIVEDESMVIMLLQDTLADIGCEVIGLASRFHEAMDKAKSLSFDVAVLDFNLDGAQTFSIAEEIAKRGIGYVFSTGYEARSLPDSVNRAQIVQKPFRRQDLERALRAALKGIDGAI
jgi:two-component SAPR family response regulator